MASTDSDEVHHFLAECHRLTSQANFLIDSIPNAETEATESMIRKLYAVRSILHDLNDPLTTPEEIQHLCDFIESKIQPLESFLESPPLPTSSRRGKV